MPQIDYKEIERRKHETPEQSAARLREQLRQEREELNRANGNKVYKSPLEQSQELLEQEGNPYFGDSPIWSAVASGNLKAINDYYKGGAKPNQRFSGFGTKHSLIMNAVRNGRWDVVDALQKYGETILPEEQDEYNFSLEGRGK